MLVSRFHSAGYLSEHLGNRRLRLGLLPNHVKAEGQRRDLVMQLVGLGKGHRVNPVLLQDALVELLFFR